MYTHHNQGPGTRETGFARPLGAPRPRSGRGVAERPQGAERVGGGVHNAFLKFAGAIFNASRYLATVRRAHSMPCSLSMSES